MPIIRNGHRVDWGGQASDISCKRFPRCKEVMEIRVGYIIPFDYFFIISCNLKFKNKNKKNLGKLERLREGIMFPCSPQLPNWRNFPPQLRRGNAG